MSAERPAAEPEPSRPSPAGRLAAMSRDRWASLVTIFGFAIALGVATITIPLLALAAGYDTPAVGLLVATSAVSQLATRFTLPWLLGRFSDRVLIRVAGLIMLTGFAILLVTTVLPAFIAAQLCQGAARSVFWTSSQTHVIRGSDRPVARLVDLNLTRNAGTLIGPALAGSLATVGLQAALAAAVIGAGTAALATLLLDPHPPYDRHQSGAAMALLGRRGVDVACWASLAGGTWWSLLGSYIPVILVGAGFGATLTGWLVTISEGAGTVVLLSLRRLRDARVAPLLVVATLAELGAIAGIAISPPSVPLLLGLLLVGGATAGTVTSLGPAMVSLVSTEHEQGNGLALTGIFRSIALLGAPAGVSGLLAVLTLPSAIVALSGTVAATGLVLLRPRDSKSDRRATTM
jgi:Major Facilitator Superfamily